MVTVSQHKIFFTKAKIRSLCVALILLVLSMIFQFYASAYSTRNSEKFVGDIFLDNVPVINVNPIIIEGALWFIVFTICLLIIKPQYSIFAIKAAAIFIALRSFFVAITHLGIYPDQLVPGNDLFDNIYKGLHLQAGYFFSGHTGLPFLMALIFWNNKKLRILYICISIILGISVLLAHVHYSIDVFAAPFMAYSIFKISEYLFNEDYRLITET